MILSAKHTAALKDNAYASSNIFDNHSLDNWGKSVHKQHRFKSTILTLIRNLIDKLNKTILEQICWLHQNNMSNSTCS